VCHSKHVEPLKNFVIVNSITKLHLVGISTECSWSVWPAGSDHLYDCLPRVTNGLQFVLLLKDLYSSITTKLYISILTSKNVMRLPLHVVSGHLIRCCRKWTKPKQCILMCSAVKGWVHSSLLIHGYFGNVEGFATVEQFAGGQHRPLGRATEVTTLQYRPCLQQHLILREQCCNWPTAVRSVNTLRTGSFKLFKRPLPGFLTILTL